MLIIDFLIVIILCGIAAILDLFPALYKDDHENSDNVYNSFCQEQQIYQNLNEANNQSEIKKLNFQNFQPTYFLNSMSCYWFRYQRMIWIWADGLPSDSFKDLWEETLETTTQINVKPPYVKASGQIHDSYMIGRTSKNYVAIPQQYDSIFHQMQNCELETKFVGLPFPVDSLAHKYFDYTEIDTKKDHYLFDQICDGPEFEDFLTYKAQIDSKDPVFAKYKSQYWMDWDEKEMRDYLNQYFSDYQISDQTWKKCLDQKVFNQNGIDLNQYNFMYYTTLADHYNHWWGKKNLQNFYSIFRIEVQYRSFLNYIKQNHPDTPLMITSDHGGQQYYGEDIAEVHGYPIDEDTNDALLYLSTVDIELLGSKKSTIDYLDLASTSSQILQNTNIPLGNLGTPESLYSNKFHEFLTKFSHYNQLKEYAHFLSQYDSNLIQKINQEVDFNYIDQQIQNYNDQLSQQYSLNDFLDNDNNSIKTKANINKLNSIDNQKLQDLIYKNNQIIIGHLNEHMKSSNKQWVFILLLTLSVSGFVFYFYKNRNKIVILRNLTTDLPRKEKYTVILGFILFLTDFLFMLFIWTLGQKFLFYSNFAYVGIKVIIIILLYLPIQDYSEKSQNLSKNLLKNSNQNQKEENQNFNNDVNQQNISMVKISSNVQNNDTQQSIDTQQSLIENDQNQDDIDQQFNNSNDNIFIKYAKYLWNKNEPCEKTIVDQFVVPKLNNFFGKFDKLKLILIISTLINIITISFTFDQTYMRLKLHPYILYDWYIFLNFTLYFVFYLITLLDGQTVLYDKNDGIIRSNFQKRIDIYVYRGLILLMAIYDCNKHNREKSYTEFFMNLLIMIPLLAFAAYKIISVNIPNQPLKENQFQHNFTQTIKLLTYVLIFYIADLPDKIFILFIIMPITYLFIYYIKDESQKQILRIFLILCLIRESGILYSMMEGNFQLGLNRAASNAVFGKVIEDNPIWGAQLQGIAKIQALAIPYLAILTYFLIRKNDKNNIVLDQFGKLLNFLLLGKIYLIGVGVYFILIVTQSQGFYFEWTVLYYIGLLALLFYPIIIPIYIFSLRYCKLFNNDKINVSQFAKKIIISSIALSYFLYLIIFNPYY